MKNSKFKLAWLALLVAALTALAAAVISVRLIQPFAPQTECDVAISFALKIWSPGLTVIAAILSFGVAFWPWRNSRRR